MHVTAVGTFAHQLSPESSYNSREFQVLFSSTLPARDKLKREILNVTVEEQIFKGGKIEKIIKINIGKFNIF